MITIPIIEMHRFYCTFIHRYNHKQLHYIFIHAWNQMSRLRLAHIHVYAIINNCICIYNIVHKIWLASTTWLSMYSLLIQLRKHHSSCYQFVVFIHSTIIIQTSISIHIQTYWLNSFLIKLFPHLVISSKIHNLQFIKSSTYLSFI